MRQLKEENIRKILLEYQKGKSIRDLKKLLNVSVGSIHKYLSENNLLRKHNVVKELNSQDERLIGLYIGLWMGDGTQYFDKSKGSYTVKICSDKRNILLNKFIVAVIHSLFGKKIKIIEYKNTNQAYLKFESKFIFDFVYDYITQKAKLKTYTVRLRNSISLYTSEFLEGCLLGLVLSDGYLKYKFSFNVISIDLATNLQDILLKFGFSPYRYIDKREKYKWNDIQIISLSPKESRRLESLLDDILRKLHYACSFRDLKYGPAVI